MGLQVRVTLAPRESRSGTSGLPGPVLGGTEAQRASQSTRRGVAGLTPQAKAGPTAKPAAGVAVCSPSPTGVSPQSPTAKGTLAQACCWDRGGSLHSSPVCHWGLVW